MKYSTSGLNGSVQVNISVDTDSAIEAIAHHTANLVRNCVSFILHRAVDDASKVHQEINTAWCVVTDKVSRDCSTVINAGASTRAFVESALNANYAIAKANVIEAVHDAVETRDALIAATKVKVADKFKVEVLNPARDNWNTEVVTRVSQSQNHIKGAIARYLQSTPVDVQSQEVLVDAIAKQNEINAAIQLESAAPVMEEKPQVIDGALVSSAGVTDPNKVASKKSTPARKRTKKAISEVIKEEAAKHS